MKSQGPTQPGSAISSIEAVSTALLLLREQLYLQHGVPTLPYREGRLFAVAKGQVLPMAFNFSLSVLHLKAGLLYPLKCNAS